MLNQLSTADRLDIVWDRYLPDSLKSHTRLIRGDGMSLRVEANTRLSSNWKSFFRVNSNKTSLFHFLAENMSDVDVPNGKVLCTTLEDKVLCSQTDVSDLEPCNHEEADTRMLLHCKHAATQGFKNILVVATDTDVVLLSIALAPYLDCQLWLNFGHGAHKRYIPSHQIAEKLGLNISRGLLLFHAFTGCDTVSTFSGIGKTTAWNVWMPMKEIITPIFIQLSMPAQIDEAVMCQLERFTVAMYKSTLPILTVNEARMNQGDRNIENILPTQDALIQHAKRAAYQSGHIWGQTLDKHPVIPCPSEWGWTREETSWVHKWTTLPEAAKVCRELLKCGCKTNCSGRCRCCKAGLRCTHLCFCSGQCAQ
ncbi:hypothetical protein SNE40_016405 [Patella caerulea]|uniref:Uncharacterized protein n=1 Tax=Patella caerulea TaxID=87958 RepID=A0AAN8JDJ3_PATCE